MARWRLIEPHYLLTKDPTMWEYQETDRITGRQKRVQFEVPRYVHHEDATEWNVIEGRDAGYVAVCNGNNPQPRDIIFRGEPTPGMIALDDEAREISDKYKDKWAQPTSPLENGEAGWATKLTDQFLQSQDKIAAGLVEVASKPIPGMEQLLTVLGQVMKQQQELVASLAKGK